MCGIVGLIQYDNINYQLKKKVFNQLLFLDTVRGEDGTGIFYANEFDTPSDFYKKAIPAPDFIQLRPYTDIVMNIERMRFIIGHNRAATTGGVSTATTHPFQENHITLIHNGTLRDRVGLPRREVDSNSIAAALSEEKDPIKVLEGLNGAFALIWHNEETNSLYITRNSDRPLHFVETNIGKLIASEKGMLEWIIERTPDLKQEKDIESFEEHRLYKFWKTKKGKVHFHSSKYDCKVIYEKSSSYYSSCGHFENENIKVLNKLGMKLGDRLKVVGHSFEKYAGNLNHAYGKLICKLVGGDKIGMHVEFNIHSVKEEVSKHFIGKEFFAKVSSAHQDYYKTSAYKVTLNFLTKNEEDALIKDKPKGDKEVLSLPSKVKNKGSLVRLPDNRWVGKLDFLAYVKDGCSICSHDISWEDRYDIEWIGSNIEGVVEPICPRCVSQLSSDCLLDAAKNTH